LRRASNEWGRSSGCRFGIMVPVLRMATTKGHGIGMQNTRERLAYFYPGMHEFAAAPLATGGYEVTIQIPYERAIA